VKKRGCMPRCITWTRSGLQFSKTALISTPYANSLISLKKIQRGIVVSSVLTMLFLIIASQYLMPAAAQTSETLQLSVLRLGSVVVFSGEAADYSNVTISVWKRLACQGIPFVEFSVNTGPSGTYNVHVTGVPNSVLPGGMYSAQASIQPTSAVSYCAYFSIPYL
jgi:hypothetical protein